MIFDLVSLCGNFPFSIEKVAEVSIISQHPGHNLAINWNQCGFHQKPGKGSFSKKCFQRFCFSFHRFRIIDIYIDCFLAIFPPFFCFYSLFRFLFVLSMFMFLCRDDFLVCILLNRSPYLNSVSFPLNYILVCAINDGICCRYCYVSCSIGK